MNNNLLNKSSLLNNISALKNANFGNTIASIININIIIINIIIGNNKEANI